MVKQIETNVIFYLLARKTQPSKIYSRKKKEDTLKQIVAMDLECLDFTFLFQELLFDTSIKEEVYLMVFFLTSR